MRQVAMLTVLSGLLTALSWPATDFIDNIWSIAIDRSDKQGSCLLKNYWGDCREVGPLRSRDAKAVGFTDMMIDYSIANAPLQKALSAVSWRQDLQPAFAQPSLDKLRRFKTAANVFQKPSQNANFLAVIHYVFQNSPKICSSCMHSRFLLCAMTLVPAREVACPNHMRESYDFFCTVRLPERDNLQFQYIRATVLLHH
ncbi:hypothetical protein TSUD_364780 [Trifolium subterraneum]|uniref:Uncharacterized protein n=1 Tax=Trifolium subterraneum TaxID=3900 RepID=A0A2Z6MKW9_TRISU|nr:hypothetical protein TSUD_364780 [Trifolium subterraneum]